MRPIIESRGAQRVNVIFFFLKKINFMSKWLTPKRLEQQKINSVRAIEQVKVLKN